MTPEHERAHLALLLLHLLVPHRVRTADGCGCMTGVLTPQSTPEHYKAGVVYVQLERGGIERPYHPNEVTLL